MNGIDALLISYIFGGIIAIVFGFILVFSKKE